MEIIIGILILLTFFGFVFYAVKGKNLMMGLLLMSIIWTGLSLLGNALVTNEVFIATHEKLINTPVKDALKLVFQDGPESWGPVLVNIFFGSWFGRILLETGITSTVIRKTVELGGDRPVITMSLLSVVVALIFTSMQGAGPVIAIGVITLPILLSLGVPKVVAIISYMGSVAAGIYLNPVIFSQYAALFNKDGKPTYVFDQYYRIGMICFAIQLVAVMIYSGVLLKQKPKVYAWAVKSTTDEGSAPALSLICILFPVLFVILFKLPVIVGFVFAGFYALFTCGKLKNFNEACRIYSKTFHDGVVDAAPLVGLFLVMPMFSKASSLCVPYFQAVLGNIIPKSTLLICVIFAVFAILGLFRGPFTYAGCGAATIGVLAALGIPVAILYPIMNVTTITMNVGACVTQSWIQWGLGYAKVDNKDFLRLSIPYSWAVSIIAISVIYFIIR